MVTKSDQEKLTDWLERELGGKVLRCSRQARWRPGWFIDFQPDDGEEIALFARGARTERFPPWPMRREAAILVALAEGGIPVPHVHGYCPDPEALILARIPGRPNLETAVSDAEREAVKHTLAEVVAAMHRLDIHRFADADIAVPSDAAGRALAYFSESEALYRMYKSAPDPRMEFVCRWVHEHIPKGREQICFLHGDPGQFLFEDGRLTTMLDFEWGCIGDPMIDLAGIRIRSLYEPMGDIAPLFRRYTALTGNTIDAESLAFHTTAWMVSTSLMVSPDLAAPNPGADYPQYVTWYLISLIFTLRAIAEPMGLVLQRPQETVESRPSRWSPALTLVANTFGDDDAARDDAEPSTAARERSLARDLTRFALALDARGADLERPYVAAVSELLGKPCADWREADSELEAFVLTCGPEHDTRLITLFHDWAWRQLLLVDGLVDYPMFHLPMQPLSDLVTSRETDAITKRGASGDD